jgi:hypothetical protein
MSQFAYPDNVPIKLAPFQWSFAPGIGEMDKDPLKRIFAEAAHRWLMENILEAVTALQADPDLKLAYRIGSSGTSTNRKTGQPSNFFVTPLSGSNLTLQRSWFTPEHLHR